MARAGVSTLSPSSCPPVHPRPLLPLTPPHLSPATTQSQTLRSSHSCTPRTMINSQPGCVPGSSSAQVSPPPARTRLPHLPRNSPLLPCPAGLRAKVQAGSAFMNDLVVLQATQGLARYALRTQPAPPAGTRLRVVVGHDHRSAPAGNSQQFAQLAARVFEREGFEVLLLDGLVHTPMVVSRPGSRLHGRVLRGGADAVHACSRSRRNGWGARWGS